MAREGRRWKGWYDGRRRSTDRRRRRKFAQRVQVVRVEPHKIEDDEHATGVGVVPMVLQVRPLVLYNRRKSSEDLGD